MINSKMLYQLSVSPYCYCFKPSFVMFFMQQGVIGITPLLARDSSSWTYSYIRFKVLCITAYPTYIHVFTRTALSWTCDICAGFRGFSQNHLNTAKSITNQSSYRFREKYGLNTCFGIRDWRSERTSGLMNGIWRGWVDSR